MLQGPIDVRYISLAGIVKQEPKCVFGRNNVAAQYNVLGYAIESANVARKSTLHGQRMAYIYDVNFVLLRIQNVKLTTGVSLDPCTACVGKIVGWV